MTVEGKMFGLTFHEQWYMLGMGDDYRVVAYKGDTQQGPYEGAFVYTKEADSLKDAGLRSKIDAAVKAGGLNPGEMQLIDNACPADATASGASLEDQGKEKLEWKVSEES